MACLLQPECNFLHGYFRCWLLVEEVDVEVKITSMQGTHIFRRDRIYTADKMYWMEHQTLPTPHYHQENEGFPRDRRKNGPHTQPTSSQYRPTQLDTNPKVRKDNAAEKRKRVVPTRRFRPSAAPKPNETATEPPATVFKAPEDPENRTPPLEKAPVCKSTPWPGAGRMSGNLFEDRNWLLPPNYLNNDCKKATSPKSNIKEEPKTGEQEKCEWEPDCPFCKDQEKDDWDGKHQVNSKRFHPHQKYRDYKPDECKTWTIKRPRTHRNLPRRCNLVNMHLKQKSNGKQRWKD